MQDLIRTVLNWLIRFRSYSPLVVAVEMVLIGLVVWWVVRFLRGTRGVRLVKGAAVLLVGGYVIVRLLPREMGWERIELLYGKFLLFAFLALIVAFQPELRRALIAIGQAEFFRRVPGEVERLAGELVSSAADLSRNKIGAIVAIERSVGLGTWIETGTPLEADVTRELLNTIFHPGTSLHDMGVVIRGDRIAAAGCQFPLAESEEVDTSLGTRHRAALGLAKECDAVVLVVSEETGRVSLAYDGQLFVGLELENLRETLIELLAPRRVFRRRRARTRKP